MQVAQILKTKPPLVTIAPDASILEAVRLLKEKNIGAVVVTGVGGRLVGILSERDIARALADRSTEIASLRVEALMTRSVITCHPHHRVNDLMADMTENRIRHLPVVDGGALIGIVSIGDVVKHRMEELESETSMLREYISSG